MKGIFIYSFLFLISLFSRNCFPGTDYEIVKYNLYMDLSACFQSPYKSDFSAYEILTIKINQNTNYILLDGDCNSLKIDSIKGPLKSIKHTDNKLSLYTLKDFKANDTLKIIIYYKYKNTDYSSFKCYNGQVYTDDIPDGAATWFFCLDKPNEKAYTDISVKVPFNVRLCSVGKMIMYNQNSGYAYYRWVSEYPVSTYIIALVASNDYNVKLYWWKSKNNPSDSLEVKLYWNNNIDEKYCIELIFKMLDFYTNLFGKFPFEKLAFASLKKNTPFQWGGVSNQSLIILNNDCWTETIIAHEIAHQWIGDMVTIDSFADLWIIEGLASYAEALWAETKSRDEYEFKMEYFKYNYISLNSTQVIYDPEISNHSLSTSSLYDAGIVYCKSACVFHMFRNVVGDSIFFTILKSFFSEEKFRHKTVSTEQFVKYINEKSNKNYNWFFNAWLNQSYHPVYKFNYTISKADSIYSRIMINISQESTSFFPMLIEIRIIDENKVSNTIRIMNDKKNQTVQLKYKGKPKQIIFDPENKIILKDVNVRS